jgi:hypothetical protein
MSLFLDILQQIGGFGTPQTAADIGTAATGNGVFGSLTAFFATITDGKMWRSLGWILLGIMIMAFGINLWLKNPIGRGVAAVIP